MNTQKDTHNSSQRRGQTPLPLRNISTRPRQVPSMIMHSISPLLLLSMATALLSTPVQASSSSSSLSDSPLLTFPTTRNCTDSQSESIQQILTTDASVLACKAAVKTASLFDLPDESVLCNVTSCTLGFNFLYSVLPECYSNGTTLMIDAYTLLTNCGIEPHDKNTDSILSSLPSSSSQSSSSSLSSGSVAVDSSSSGSTSTKSVGTTATPSATAVAPTAVTSASPSPTSATAKKTSGAQQNDNVVVLAFSALLVLSMAT